MPEQQLDIPSLIKRIRQIAGLTQVELANGLGVAPTSIHRYEAGASNPSPAILRDLLAFVSQQPDLSDVKTLIEMSVRSRTSPLVTYGDSDMNSYQVKGGTSSP